MDRKGEDFLALQEYVTAKATLLERLAQMEDKRDKIKKVIFDKIRADYDGQLKKLIDDFRPVRIRVIQKLSDFEQEMAQVEKKLTFAQDKVIELRFRHQLGEYGEEEFRRMEYEHLAQVDNIQATWDELNVDLDDYRNLIGDDKDFQRRYAFDAAPEPVEAVDEPFDPQITEPDSFESSVPVSDATAAYEITPAVPPIAVRDAASVARETATGRKEPRAPAYFSTTPDIEETEEGTESTQDTALMDDEELFGQYYREQDSETEEIEQMDELEPGYEDQSGTMEMPSGLAAAAASFSAEDSSTGVWSTEAALAPLPPPPSPPAKTGAGGVASAKPASFLGWKEEEEDDKDSTMVWGAVPVQEVQAAAAAAAAPPAKSLIFRDKKNSKEVAYPLGRAEISIGRSQDNDIVLTEGKISRRHAKVQFSDGGYLLSDLNSSNGTFVNGKKIARPVMLRDNDEILIGDSSMTFR